MIKNIVFKKINKNYIMVHGHLETFVGMDLSDYTFNCIVENIVEFSETKKLLIVKWKDDERTDKESK